MKEWMPGVGSVLTAFLSSICCIGPLVGVALGIGGLSAAAALESYRPYFLVITFAFLGGAFYLTYGRRSDCAGVESCETRHGGRWQRILLWVSAAGALVLAGAPYLLSLVA